MWVPTEVVTVAHSLMRAFYNYNHRKSEWDGVGGWARVHSVCLRCAARGVRCTRSWCVRNYLQFGFMTLAVLGACESALWSKFYKDLLCACVASVVSISGAYVRELHRYQRIGIS